MPVDMKSVISTTFVNMAKEKGVDKITVKSLIEACHISRQSFYYHFQDIMEVIEWSLKQAAQDMLVRSQKAENPEEALVILISSAVANRTLVRKLLASQKREQIEKMFVQTARSYLQALLQTKSQKIPLSYAETETALDFWTFGITGLLFKSCEQESIDEKKMASQIGRLLPKIEE